LRESYEKRGGPICERREKSLPVWKEGLRCRISIGGACVQKKKDVSEDRSSGVCPSGERSSHSEEGGDQYYSFQGEEPLLMREQTPKKKKKKKEYPPEEKGNLSEKGFEEGISPPPKKKKNGY